ncbi:MAG: hypothetical protein MZV65_22020 [Chromatiales bacterium]|nr:hypothetical protein [Chromatiales bacterium]
MIREIAIPGPDWKTARRERRLDRRPRPERRRAARRCASAPARGAARIRRRRGNRSLRACFVDQAGLHVHSLFLSQSEGRYLALSIAFILQRERLIGTSAAATPGLRLLLHAPRRRETRSRPALLPSSW